MKIGVTGAKGFIGKSIINELQKRKIKAYGFDLPENDVLDQSSLKKFLAGKDVIIHTAAVNRGTDFDIISTGIVGTYNLTLSKKRIVFLSSIQATNDNVFGLSKRICEKLLESFSKEKKIPVSILRIPNVFGENCRPFYNSVVATFCYQINRGQKIKVSSDKRKIPFIYIKDLAKIIVNETLAQRKKYFFKEIPGQERVTVAELARILNSFKSEKKPKSKFYKNLYQTFLSYK